MTGDFQSFQNDLNLNLNQYMIQHSRNIHADRFRLDQMASPYMLVQSISSTAVFVLRYPLLSNTQNTTQTYLQWTMDLFN